MDNFLACNNIANLVITVRDKILEGENFGKWAISNNWRIIYWQILSIT